jgi:hypothetical protein
MTRKTRPHEIFLTPLKKRKNMIRLGMKRGKKMGG